MPIEIFPQNLSLFPDNEQLFTARNKDLKPYWANIQLSNTVRAFVGPDFSLQGSFEDKFAEGALQLMRGIGSLEFTIARQSMPAVDTATMQWNFYFDSGQEYFVVIKLTTVSIEDSGGVITTLPHNVAVGDKFRIELNSGFRLFINDTLRHELVTGFSTEVQYPATYDAAMLNSVLEAPTRVPAPLLKGDWQLRPVVQFVTPAHGSLTSNGPGLQTTYFDGSLPGIYKLIGKIDPGLDIWVDDDVPTGASISTTGGTWNFDGVGSPAPFIGAERLLSPSPTGHGTYSFSGATATLQINVGDVIVCYVFINAADPTTEIMLRFTATDSTGFEHRAYWGANSIAEGTDGTASRRFMGPLPATGQWVRLEVPANLVDLEGRTLNGMRFSVFDGICSFDLVSKYPSKLQSAEALLTIAALEILGPRERTVQPSAKIRLQANYEDAQTLDLVAWSITSGGGSLSGNEFTAPATPGATVIRATSGDQIAEITINVPAVITPNFSFVGPLEQVDFDTNIPATVTWSSVPSGINSSTGVWTVPNDPGRKIRVTASNGTFIATLDLLIMKKFPISRFFSMEGQRSKKVLVSEAEDGTDVSRVKDKDGKARDGFPLQIKSLTLTEYESIKTFWDEHHPGKRFILEDVPRNIRLAVKFDSDLAWRTGANRFDVTFRVKEVAGL